MSYNILLRLKIFIIFPAINCKWNDWVEGECSAPCGKGKRENTRTKNVVEANGGTCTGLPTDTVGCKIKECTSVSFILFSSLF